jgi:hypothetical protein
VSGWVFDKAQWMPLHYCRIAAGWQDACGHAARARLSCTLGKRREGCAMKKRLAMAGIGLVPTACAIALFGRPGSSINAESYQQIEVGMTRRQVEDILGGTQ